MVTQKPNCLFFIFWNAFWLQKLSLTFLVKLHHLSSFYQFLEMFLEGYRYKEILKKFFNAIEILIGWWVSIQKCWYSGFCWHLLEECYLNFYLIQLINPILKRTFLIYYLEPLKESELEIKYLNLEFFELKL